VQGENASAFTIDVAVPGVTLMDAATAPIATSPPPARCCSS
jgi:hypothetical protein